MSPLKVLGLLWVESWLLWVWGHVGTCNRCLCLNSKRSLDLGRDKPYFGSAEVWMTALCATRRSESPSQPRWTTTSALQRSVLPPAPSLQFLLFSKCFLHVDQVNEAECFLTNLSMEVQKRLQEAGLRGRRVTLKVMVRKVGAPQEPAKYGGHGICDNLAR